MKRCVAIVAILGIGMTAHGRAAGKSDVADAVMKGDAAALHALLRRGDVDDPQRHVELAPDPP